MEVRRAGLAGLVTFHTHPLATEEVDFSYYDDVQDPLLAQNLQELWPDTLLASIVLGQSSQNGRVWTRAALREPLLSLVSVGERLECLSLEGRRPAPPPKASEIFDRAEAITGNGALALLRKMTVAVIGASGTGSLVCELLARAGCARILLIDHDVVKLPNLNRILHATISDAEARRPKAIVLKEAIERLNLGCEVVAVAGSILDDSVLQRLNEADIVFGCVDKDYPRLLLCKYSYRHIVPYIDVGTEIGGDQEGIVSTDARTSYVAPGRWCLRCAGLVNARRLTFESLTAEERGRQKALGYSDDLVLKHPAVMDLNMRAASAGTMLLRHLLQPFLREPFPIKLSENLTTYNLKPVERTPYLDESCDICRADPQAGFGDCGVPIGLTAEIAAALLDKDP
jgi:hypothetical protein